MRKFNLKFNPKRRGKGGTGQGKSCPVPFGPFRSFRRVGQGVGREEAETEKGSKK